jgi:hypothetical protein
MNGARSSIDGHAVSAANADDDRLTHHMRNAAGRGDTAVTVQAHGVPSSDRAPAARVTFQGYPAASTAAINTGSAGSMHPPSFLFPSESLAGVAQGHAATGLFAGPNPDSGFGPLDREQAKGQGQGQGQRPALDDDDGTDRATRPGLTLSTLSHASSTSSAESSASSKRGTVLLPDFCCLDRITWLVAIDYCVRFGLYTTLHSLTFPFIISSSRPANHTPAVHRSPVCRQPQATPDFGIAKEPQFEVASPLPVSVRPVSAESALGGVAGSSGINRTSRRRRA